MNEHEIKIIDTHVLDNDQLRQALKEGYRLVQAIHYVNFYMNYKTVYMPNGNTEQVHEKQNEEPKIKYILERDGISRLLNG